MTEEKAKEIIISAMNFVAYSEFGFSLFRADKNWLFGSHHYGMEPNTVLAEKSSPWRVGGELHQKLPDLIRFALLRPDDKELRVALEKSETVNVPWVSSSGRTFPRSTSEDLPHRAENATIYSYVPSLH